MHPQRHIGNHKYDLRSTRAHCTRRPCWKTEICHANGWDEPVDGEVLAKWERWRSQLPLLEQLDIPRIFKPPHFGRIVTAQLHNMSNASQTGYGQCSYVRLVDGNGRIHCSLVLGKARVAPLRSITIPRLELTAATVSVRVASVLKEELDYEELQDFYGTDSKVVLGFISNESRRFHVYVANRVQFIRDQTSPEQWRYVESGSNLADEGVLIEILCSRSSEVSVSYF